MRVFYAVAQESLEEMRFHTKKYSRPKPNGELGMINVLDPKQKGFKKAMITIVFCGICLDALLHLQIGTRLGVDECRRTDHKTYEDKLKLLGCEKKALLDACSQFRESRRKIVHEKAHIDNGKFKIAQREAEKSMATLDSVCQFLKVSLGQ